MMTKSLKSLKEILTDERHFLHHCNLESRTVKMNTLPRVNFLSAMIPLPPLLKWWKRLDSLIRNFLWNGKQPKCLLCNVLKLRGGLSLPNFELYHKAFQLRAVKI